jgi:signal transduction histidine kinase
MISMRKIIIIMMCQGKARDTLQSMSTKLRDRMAVWADWLIVLALGGLAFVEIWEEASFAGPRPINTLLFGFAILALLWRRLAPITVLFIAVATLGIQANFFDPSSQPPLTGFLILQVAFYSVAAHGKGRRAIIGGAVAGAAAILVIDLPRLLSGENPGDIVPTWAAYAIAWIFGRLVGQGRLKAARLQDLAAQLEREREEKARLAVADERSRIARELHNVVAHSVSVIVVQAQAAQRLLEGEQQGARQALGSIEETGRQALAEMRRLLGILHRSGEDPALAPQPSLEHLDALIERTREAGLTVELRIEGEPEPLAPGLDLTAYRIVQEALTNALKHAGPAHAEVVVRYTSEELELEITDDGPGTGNGGGAGHGLIGMRERLSLYGGDLESGRRNGGGYLIRARLPLDPD